MDSLLNPNDGFHTSGDHIIMQTRQQLNSLHNSFDNDCVERLSDNIRRRIPFYVRMQISSYEARVAFLMNAFLDRQRDQRTNLHAFYCSSTIESISGAIKLVRHNLYAGDATCDKSTVVYDPTDGLRQIFDPLNAGPNDAWVPGLQYFNDFDAFDSHIRDKSPPSILLRYADSLPIESLDEVIQFARDNRVYSILDESSTDLQHDLLSARLSSLPDIVSFGENLGNHRVPTGCFLIREQVFEVWNSAKDYNIHSNTWGGNSASLSVVLDFLKSTKHFQTLPESMVGEVENVVRSHHAVTNMYKRHCSPKMAAMLNLGGLNKNIQSASEATIETASASGTRSVIDASGTYGVNLRGHNPQEVLTSVLACHDISHDYWMDLERMLEKETGLPRTFPAVSGATSTEAALAMALLAAAPKTRIVAIKGGFSGKTLFSLISTSRDRFKVPFQPLYPHVSFVDPFDGHGETQLRELCEQGDVAVVILETVQGEGCVRAIPQPFLDALAKLRVTHDFSIIVDEVQTGMFRTGRFLSYQGKIEEVDIVAMGKAMSGNVFPVSAALTSERVYQRALKQNSQLVERYRNQYRCQFGAHMAIDSIEVGYEQNLMEHAKERGRYFLERLKETTNDLHFVKEVRGEGLMIGIEFEESKLPGLIRGDFGGLVASRCINDPIQPVLTAFNPDKPFLVRFVPPLCITHDEINKVIATMNRALRSGVIGLLKPIIKNVLKSRMGRY